MTPSVRNAMMATPSARKSEDLIGIDRPSFAKIKSQNDGAAPPIALRSPAPPSPFCGLAFVIELLAFLAFFAGCDAQTNDIVCLCACVCVRACVSKGSTSAYNKS